MTRREELQAIIRDLSREFPDRRIGLVLQAAADKHKRKKNASLADLNDKELHTALTNHKEEHVRSRANRRARESRREKRGEKNNPSSKRVANKGGSR